MANKAQHTPGPWKVVTKSYVSMDGNRVFEIAGDRLHGRGPIASIVEFRGGEFGIDEANAHLIAAAPELLEALQYAYEQMEHIQANASLTKLEFDRVSNSLDRMGDAIAKAEGDCNENH